MDLISVSQLNQHPITMAKQVTNYIVYIYIFFLQCLIFHAKLNILSSFTHPHIVTNLHFFGGTHTQNIFLLISINKEEEYQASKMSQNYHKSPHYTY